MIGLSGGIDSAVLANLAVLSVGKDSVHVAYLYDRDSDKELSLSAQLMADHLGLELETQDIEPAMHERGLYAYWPMAITQLSPSINRLLFRFYRLIVGVTQFMITLPAENRESFGHRLQRLILRPRHHIDMGYRARHVYRRSVLEKEATSRNLLLLSGANHSEYMVGYFTKDGIDDLPIAPLIGLYKTQIQQLAEYLGVPDRIRTQVPSADMMKGITDEFALGISYSRLDVTLDYLHGGLARQDLDSVGIKKKEISLVREMKRMSSWKRDSMFAPTPVDGRLNGGVRI
jgi:NAD+ synthase